MMNVIDVVVWYLLELQLNTSLSLSVIFLHLAAIECVSESLSNTSFTCN